MPYNTAVPDFGKSWTVQQVGTSPRRERTECHSDLRGPELSQALQHGHKAAWPLLAAQRTVVEVAGFNS